MEASILAYPDPAKEYILDTNASDHNVGAVLSQVQGRSEVVVAYYSKTLAAAEKNYCTTRKELLAVVRAVKRFRPYLYGRTFRIRTNHVSLIWLCKRAELSSQVARWLEILAEFSYRIKHRAGKKHGNADGMSRRWLGIASNACTLRNVMGDLLALMSRHSWGTVTSIAGNTAIFGRKLTQTTFRHFVLTPRCTRTLKNCVGCRIRSLEW